MFYQEIEGFKDLQRAGYVKGYRTTQMVKMEDSDLFKGKTPGEEYKYNPAAAIARSKNLSDGHRQALLQIRERDKKIVSRQQMCSHKCLFINSDATHRIKKLSLLVKEWMNWAKSRRRLMRK